VRLRQRQILSRRRFAWLVLAAGALPGAVACSTSSDPRVEQEIADRRAYAERTLLEQDAGRLLGVSSSADVMFEEGFSNVVFLPPDDFRNHASRWIGQHAHVRLRRHPGRTMRLHIQGWLNKWVLRTNPQIALYLDGVLLRSTGPIEGEHYWIEVDVPPETVHREWSDLIIRLNTVGIHWSEPPALTVADVYKFTWTEVSP
jgi:hypothetical protein